MAGLLKRPKPGEDEDDILRMQAEFLREKNTNNLQASAQVVNLRSNEPKPQKRAHLDVDEPRKPSKFAQSRGLKNAGKKVTFNMNTDIVMGNILEKNTDDTPQTNMPEEEDDKVYFPKIIPSVLGNIIEKNTDNTLNLDFKPLPAEGFPVVTKHEPDKIITKDIVQVLEMDIEEGPASSSAAVSLPSKSYILTSKDAQTIHSDNVGILSKMSEREIMEEQQKLLSSLNPKLVEFIQSQRKKKLENKQSIPVSCAHENTNKTMELEESLSGTVQQDTLWENDVLSHPRVDKWLHFHSLEKDKLEWTKGMDQSNKVSPKEPYEARFDFKGYLLPYTIEYTEKTKSLFHHGQDTHRPGYSLTELFELSRSTIVQQRVIALNTIAGILEYYSAGTYKDIIEIPLSKILFVIRFAMDENKVIILEPALKAMRSLLYNRIDEACLDSLIGFEEGSWQPCLENDKSEIAELDSKESDLKDFHLAEIDIIAALLRTDILQRIYYILEIIKPNFNCVQYSLQILTRLTRDSVEIATKIVQAEHLTNVIVKHFLPVTSINFTFEPNIVYHGKPVLAALKFLRVLSLQSKEITKTLISKYGILKPVSEYISSGVDGTYGLRIQMEAYCILTNSLRYGVGVEAAISLMPVIVTTIYKHVQGTDVFSNSSIISASHAAVVFQYVSTLLVCDLINLDNFKQQAYVLLKDGVQKWSAQLANSESYTCAHLRLLASAFDCWKVILHHERTPVKFLSESLKMLMYSRGFKELIKNLLPSSNLLSEIENKDLHLTKNLKTLGGSVIDSAQKILPILNPTSPVPLLTSLYKLLTIVNEKEISFGFLEHVLDYLSGLLVKAPSLSDNWFTRIEVDFLFNIVKLSIQSEIAEAHKDSLYAVASKLCYILRVDKINELQYLYSNIVFNKQWFTAERLMNLVSLSDADGFSKALTSIDEIQLCYSKVVNLNYRHTGPNIVLKMWQEPILPRDWIYLPILSLYGKSQEIDNSPKVSGEHAKRVEALKAAEKESVVRSSLEWILFNELCFPDLLSDIDVTDRLCRIMCVFLCDNSLFLDKNINMLLRKCTQVIFKHKEKLNFDADLTGLHNFQDFYTQFLEQFQSVSYGDSVFASCVLVPLSQRHNVKWRKLVWSEYAGCLRALDCPEEFLCYDFDEYLYPKEEDESLVKSYFRALSTNLVRPDTLAYRIAKHHTSASGS